MKPIIFNTSMVKAILDGKKTCTRRLIKPQPTLKKGLDLATLNDVIEEDFWYWKDCRWLKGGLGMPESAIEDYAPYKIGETLYVRERARKFTAMIYVRDSGVYVPGIDLEGWNYFADDAHIRTDEGSVWEMFLPLGDTKEYFGYERWRPSIHMPREAARIFLKVKNVRAEQLQKISHVDALREGIDTTLVYSDGDTGFPTAPQVFGAMWDEIYREKGYGWSTNPWVWVYEFERIGKEET